MKIQLNAQNISTENNSTSYLVQVVADGKLIKIAQHTTNLSKLAMIYQKWAYRTYKIENAIVNVTETNWIPE